jgi:hypothetical protein
MPRTQTRVVGSGFTTFNYRGQPILWLESVADSGQAPLAGSEAVYTLESKVAREIATARAIATGTLTLTIRETWNEPVWNQLVGLSGAVDIIDVFEALESEPGDLTCEVIIKPPGAPTWRIRTYHNCVITAIDDGETISLAQLTIPKTLTVTYTHKTHAFHPAA